MVNAENFFTTDELERIRRTVDAAEAATAGEIATMVVSASDPYREGTVLGGLLLAGFVAFLQSVLLHHVTVWFYVPVTVLLTFPSCALFRAIPRLRLPFVARARIREAVRERALRAFYEKGLYRTRDATGILIFISLLERTVWILGDRGINERITPETWQGLSVELSRGMRAGEACDALCRTITRCGTILAEQFPRRLDDTDELTDQVLFER
jgi:putative membrane protein